MSQPTFSGVHFQPLASSSSSTSTLPLPVPLPPPSVCALCVNFFDAFTTDQSIIDHLRPRVQGCPAFCLACLQLQRQCGVGVDSSLVAAQGPSALGAALMRQANQTAAAMMHVMATPHSGFDPTAPLAAATATVAAPLSYSGPGFSSAPAVAAPVPAPAPSVCDECGQPAAVFCEQCSHDLCAAHSAYVHSLKIFQSHNVVAIADKTATLDAAFIRDAAGPLQRLESHVLTSHMYSALQNSFDQLSVPTELLYRASRDGFQFADWKAKCMGQAQTMTLVKAKESGFVFGAYTECAWPKDENSGAVSDPSCQSFFFSLTNAANYPVACYLRDMNGAVGLRSSGIRFGDRQPIFSLFIDGKAADEPTANAAFPLAADCSYQTSDTGLVPFLELFAGSRFFAAADIEVYQAL